MSIFVCIPTGGNWTATGTWLVLGVEPGNAPTASDDVDCTALTGTLTVNGSSFCQDCTFGAAGTLAGSSGLNISGSLNMASVTRTYTGTITFLGTSTHTITMSGRTLASIISFSTGGGTYTLQDAFLTTGTCNISDMNVNTNGVAVTSSRLTMNSGTSSLTLGATTWTITGTAGITLSTNSGSCTFSMASSTFDMTSAGTVGMTLSTGITFGTIKRTGTAAKTDQLSLPTNGLTCGTFTVVGNSAVNRVLVRSATFGTPVTITAGATTSTTNADFSDITGAGAATWNLSGVISGNCGRNTMGAISPISSAFTAAATPFWVSGTGSTSDPTKWMTTSGGAVASRVPLPQDTGMFDSASFTAGSQAVTQDMPRFGGMNFTGATNTPSLTKTTACSIFGPITLISAMTQSGTSIYTLDNGCTTITNGGAPTWTNPLVINSGNGTTSFADTFTSSNTMTLTTGELTAATNVTVTFTTISISGTGSRTFTMGTGTTWVMSATSTTVWNATTSTNLTLNKGTSTLKFTGATGACNIGYGNLTYYNSLFAGIGASSVQWSIITGGTFNDFSDTNSGVAHGISVSNGQTITLTTGTVVGTSGHLITLTSGGAGWNIVKAGGGTIGWDYLTIVKSAASPSSTFYAGTHSTDGGTNTGWTFTDPGTAPAITSSASTTFTTGSAGTFTVTSSGTPAASYTETGTLPSPVTFNTTSGVLSGTPASGTGGSYSLSFGAANGFSPDASQAFTLTVNQAPAITSTASATFTVGSSGTHTVVDTGYPDPSVSETGALPTGVTFNTSTQVLSGTPAAAMGGSYSLKFVAANGVGTAATQNFTLTVNQAPAVTSASSATFQVGNSGAFTATVTGYPTPSVSETGSLPSGVTFNTSTNVLSGTPAAATGAAYAIKFVAANGVGTAATQNFTLTVNQAPSITSASSTTFVADDAAAFTVTASGYPGPSFTETGALPSGVTFNTTSGVLSGTATDLGAYTLTFVALNGISPNSTQTFTLTVREGGTEATDRQTGLNILFYDEGSGIGAEVFTLTDGDGVLKTDPTTGLNQKWVDSGVGYFKLLMTITPGAGVDVLNGSSGLKERYVAASGYHKRLITFTPAAGRIVFDFSRGVNQLWVTASGYSVLLFASSVAAGIDSLNRTYGVFERFVDSGAGYHKLLIEEQ